MAILKIKDETGKFVDIPAIQGAPGKDGAVQYTAGENITIDENNVISASGGEDTDYVIFTNVNLSYGSTSVTSDLETYQTFIDVLKSGKTPILITKNVNNINSGTHSGIILVGPDPTSKDFNTYSGDVYFRSSLFFRTFENVFYQNKIYNETNYFLLKITISSGTVTRHTDMYIGRDNNYSNLNYDIPVLGKNNNSPYTPTGDYNPATKKYVDDTIASAITTTLGGSY